MSYSELQERCEELRLWPCRGEDELSLLEKLRIRDPELVVKAENLDLYEAIAPVVSSLPDFRPGDTVRKMRQEPQDNWRLVLNEMEALSRKGAEGDRELMDRFYNGEGIPPHYLEDEDAKDFFSTYPALVWLAAKASNTRTLLHDLIRHGNTEILEGLEIKEDDLQWIRDKKTAAYFRKRLPDLQIDFERLLASIEDMKVGLLYFVMLDPEYPLGRDESIAIEVAVESGNLGAVRLLLQDERIDPTTRDNYPLLRAMASQKLKIARVLIEDGRADPTAQIDGVDSIDMAATHGAINLLNLMLQNPKVKLNKARSQEILEKAIDRGIEKDVIELIESGKLDERIDWAAIHRYAQSGRRKNLINYIKRRRAGR